MLTSTFPEIQTERLRLRNLETSDAEVILFLRSDALVNYYIKRKPAQNKEEAIQFIEKVNKGFSENKNINWGIIFAGRLIGTICLWNFSEDRKTAEIGYDLVPDCQRKGIMNEAMRAVLDFGFHNLNFQKIEAFTHQDNETSKTLLLRNDFQLNPERKDEDNPDNVIFEKTLKLTPR